MKTRLARQNSPRGKRTKCLAFVEVYQEEPAQSFVTKSDKKPWPADNFKKYKREQIRKTKVIFQLKI